MKLALHAVLTAYTALLAPAVLAQMYNGPESVEYHLRLDRHLVSNKDGGNIIARAADGTLSEFTAAPVSPYGIECWPDAVRLDSGKLKGYDIDSAAPVLDFAISGASFLNGITSNGVDTIYLSDFSAKRIHSVNVANLAAPVQGTPVVVVLTPNGLVFDAAANRLLIATWGSNAKVLSLDLGTPGATPVDLINTSLGNIDGITLDCNGAIVVAAWNACGASGGCLRRFDRPFTLTSPAVVIANTLSSPADIDYNPLGGTIGVPESSANRVTLVPSGCGGSLFIGDFER